MTDYEEIELELSDETFLKVAKLAHEADVTLNEMINQIIAKSIDYRKLDDDKE